MEAVESSYLDELAARVGSLAGSELVGVYAGGSWALGAYEPGRSDLDVSAVVRSAAPAELKAAMVAALRHGSLPCPARGLEFVLYRLGATREPTSEAAFELNLNTGAGMDFRVDEEPGGIESFWFPIDRSILAQRGIALLGPPASEAFTDLPRRMLAPAILESLRWHIRAVAIGDDAVLNACRALRFAVDGTWSSKSAAGAWALDREGIPIVARALGVRSGGGRLDADAVLGFLEATAARIERLLVAESAGGER